MAGAAKVKRFADAILNCGGHQGRVSRRNVSLSLHSCGRYRYDLKHLHGRKTFPQNLQRRSFRMLFGIGVLLLLSIAWIRSYFGTDVTEYRIEQPPVGPSRRFHVLGVASCRGRVGFFCNDIDVSKAGRKSAFILFWQSQNSGVWRKSEPPEWNGLSSFMPGFLPDIAISSSFMGIYVSSGGRSFFRRSGFSFTYAHAICVLVVLLTPAYMRSFRIRRRHDKGLCLRCGYDLRATTDRCPECGTLSGTK